MLLFRSVVISQLFPMHMPLIRTNGKQEIHTNELILSIQLKDDDSDWDKQLLSIHTLMQSNTIQQFLIAMTLFLHLLLEDDDTLINSPREQPIVILGEEMENSFSLHSSKFVDSLIIVTVSILLRE